MGALTLPKATFTRFANYSVAGRGAALLEEFNGIIGVFRGANKATLRDWITTLPQGPTPAGWLGTLGLTAWADQFFGCPDQ